MEKFSPPKRNFPLYRNRTWKLRNGFQIQSSLKIEIHDMRQETFYANVIFRANGEEYAIDSRPSDAVALALNRKIPILVRQGLFRRRLTQEEIKQYEGLVKSVKF